VYPNLFAHAGHSAPQIKAKLDAAWNQLFHGKPGYGADPGGRPGAVLPADFGHGYVEDIGIQDVRTEGMG
jgi:oligosaccharide reducing-end xylanase